MEKNHKLILILCLWHFSILCIVSYTNHLKGFNFFDSNPASVQASVTRSLYKNQSFQFPKLNETYERVLKLSKENPDTPYWQDVFSVGKNGKLYPKHPFLNAVLALPMYAVFGDLGFWIHTQMLAILAILSVFLIMCRYTSQKNAFAWSLVASFMAGLYGSIYTFSYDVAATAFVILSFALSSKKPIFSGILLGFAIWTRWTNLLFLPFLILFQFSSDRHFLSSLKILAFSSLVILTILYVNNIIWGEPIAGGYASAYSFKNGEYLFSDVYSKHKFSLEIFYSNFYERFFNLKSGLLCKLPIIIISILLLPKILMSAKNRSLLILILASYLQILLFLSFQFGEQKRLYLPAAFILLPILTLIKFPVLNRKCTTL